MRAFPGVLLLLLVVPVRAARAQVSTAELFVNVHATAQAVDMNVPEDLQPFADGPRTADATLGSGSIPWNLQAIAGGGESDTHGTVNYLAAASQIVLGGMFTTHSAAAPPASSSVQFDAIVKITFQVSEQTPYAITGSVSTGRDLTDAEVVACQVNGVVLAGDTRATPLAAGTYPILRNGVASPGEEIAVECAAASSGGFSDANTLSFDLQLNLGGGTTTTTTLPLTKKRCKKACRKATATCRASCGALAKSERKACRRQCRQRGRSCSQSTGCQLP